MNWPSLLLRCFPIKGYVRCSTKLHAYAGAISKLMSGGSNEPLSDGQTIAAALCGGGISGIICCPMELVVIQQQRFGLSLLQTPRRIVSEFGIATMMRGVSPTIGREALFTMGYLGLGPVLANRITKSTGVEGFPAKFGGSVCAGVVAATLSHPLDTIKTCVQGDLQRSTFGSLSETVGTLHADGGAKRFFSGWSWRTSRMILAIFIMGQCKERLAPLFFPEVFAY
eukprot:m.123835 g.123835  ORF g.123835 m.123835 type:complete len:226 (-) comp17280_c0_seq4:192-869(-)